MSEIAVKFTGDESDVAAAYQKIIADQNRTIEGLKRMSDETKRAAQSSRELERAARRVYDETRTPAERHNQRLAELNTLLQRGKISQDTYTRAVANSERELTKAGKAGESAFGGAALASLARFAGGFLSLSAAVGTVTKALGDMEAKRNELAEKQKASEQGLGQLSQIAKTPEEMRQLVDFSREMYRQGGAGSLGEAGDVIFSLASAGQLGEKQFFTDLRSYGVVSDTSEMAASVQALTATMGKSEVGTARDLVSKGLVAGEVGYGTVEEILAASARSGSHAGMLRVSDEELMAATAIMATAQKSPERGGERVLSLLRSFTEHTGGGAVDTDKATAAKVQLGQVIERLNEQADNDRVARDTSGLSAVASLLDQGKYTEAIASIGQQQAELSKGIPTAASAARFDALQAARITLEQAGVGSSPIQRGSIRDMIRQVEAMGMDDAELQKWLGRSEAFEAFAALRDNMGQLEHMTSLVGQGQTTDEAGRRLAINQTIPELRASRERRMAEAEAELSGTQLAIAQNASEAAISRDTAAKRATGHSEWEIWAGEKVQRLERFFMGPPNPVRPEELGPLEPGVKEAIAQKYGPQPQQPPPVLGEPPRQAPPVDPSLPPPPPIDTRGFNEASRRLGEAAVKMEAAANRADRRNPALGAPGVDR